MAALGIASPPEQISAGGKNAAALLSKADGWMKTLPPDGTLIFSGHGPNLMHLLKHFRCPPGTLGDRHGAVLVLRREVGGWSLEAVHPRAG